MRELDRRKGERIQVSIENHQSRIKTDQKQLHSEILPLGESGCASGGDKKLFEFTHANNFVRVNRQIVEKERLG